VWGENRTTCPGGSRNSQSAPNRRYASPATFGVTMTSDPPGLRMRRHSARMASGSWKCSMEWLIKMASKWWSG
jgi:hypothetical protein